MKKTRSKKSRDIVPLKHQHNPNKVLILNMKVYGIFRVFRKVAMWTQKPSAVRFRGKQVNIIHF
jgi:hypothetical protein